MILALGAALVIPCFLIAEVIASKKLPTGDIALGMLLAFALGGVLSSYLGTVIPGGWFTSLASSARQNPWTYVLPVILLIGALGAGIERIAGAMPFCRKCKKWFSVLPSEWIIPPDVMLTKDVKAFSGDELFWSKITKLGGPAPADGMTIHSGASHCQSIRLALCPDCKRGIAHVAEVKPTLYFGNQGASVGIVQRDVGYVSVPERIVKDMANKLVQLIAGP
jgi:hypothetical protein